MALTFDDVLESELASVLFTGHLRLGSSRYFRLLITSGELRPISVAGWYDSNGVVQVVEVPIGDRFALDVIGRYGSSSPVDEWGLALGATVQLGR